MITDEFRKSCFQRFAREFPPPRSGENLNCTLERFYTWILNMHFVEVDRGGVIMSDSETLVPLTKYELTLLLNELGEYSSEPLGKHEALIEKMERNMESEDLIQMMRDGLTHGRELYAKLLAAWKKA